MRHVLPPLQDVMQEIQSVARDRGIPMGRVLTAAGVHRWTWQRWVDGKTEPQYSRVRAMQTALFVVLADRP